MSAFPDCSDIDRQRVRVCSRGLFVTDSVLVEFVTETGRECFPLVSGYGTGLMSYDNVWRFGYELDGYFLIDAAAKYNNLVTGPYEKSHIGPLENNTCILYKPFRATFQSAVYGTIGGIHNLTNGTQHLADVTATYSDRFGNQTTVQYNASAPVVVEDAYRIFSRGLPYAPSFDGWSTQAPAFSSWLPFIQNINEIGADVSSKVDGWTVDVLQPNGSVKVYIASRIDGVRIDSSRYLEYFYRYTLFLGADAERYRLGGFKLVPR